MNIEEIRNDTPGTKNVIHLNNAGASLMPKPVSKSVIDYLNEELNYGGYETAHKFNRELAGVYDAIAGFINAKPDEIAILENATSAWNMAFFSIDFDDGDRILTSVSEYASNYISYLRLRRDADVRIEVIPNDKNGQTSIDALQKMMDGDVRLISITHIPTNSGLVNPAEQIGQIAQEHDCLYLVDACQSVGQYPVDVQKMGCDMLSATGRKYLRGPRGTGFLYVNSEKLSRLMPPFLDLHSAEWTAKDQYNIRDDARRFENWEFNYAGVLGLKTAVEYADELGIENIWNRVTFLADQLRGRLEKIAHVTVLDIGKIKGGIVTFSVDSVPAKTVQEKLSEQNINVSISSRSSTLLDMRNRQLDELVRASVHYFNTEQEIKKLTEVLDSDFN